MIMSPEALIYDLQCQVTKLTEELTQAKQDIEDFEQAAIVWKKGYADMEREYKIKLGNAKQTIEELEKEVDRVNQNWSRN